MRRVFLDVMAILGLACLPALVVGLSHGEAAAEAVPLEAGQVAMADVAELGDGLLWVDARTRAKYEQAHVPGAVHLTPSGWDEGLKELLDAWRPGQAIVVYCDAATCQASEEVAGMLRDLVGLSDVYVLHGGWEAWQAWQE
ncbi:MAG: rhodanese-like domain-containing protein [Phycisphaeraceae bacterium]